jgi:signal transduction histidine kinase/EAL domain-containing protein (putative c-di-GMP-specific phosphodiesterase class I)/CheY-like chemotaxis protein/HPt (histidine-containing phosphotransfer) domain-containing protein
MLLVVGSVLVCAAPMAGVFAWQETAREATNRWIQMRTAAEVMAASSVEAIETRDSARAFGVLRAVSRSPGVRYARISLAGGLVLAENGVGSRLRSDVQVRVGERPPGVTQLLVTRSIEVSAPVMAADRVIGEVRVVHEAGDLAARVAGKLALAVLVALGALAGGLLLAWPVQRRLTGPLLRVTSSIRQITADGRFDGHVHETGSDEVGDLVDSFNTMIDAIAERDARICAQVRGLEQAVAERTAEYEAARDAAQAANAAKSDFLATMSHEIRTPMNGVMVMAELLAGGDLPSRARRHAQTIVTSGRNLMAVINDILDFSKIEAGRLEVEAAEVDIVALVDDTLSLFHARAREKGLELAALIHPDAPRFVPADPVRLAQVLSNLVSNALKFTEAGHVLVRVEPEAAGTHWRLSVTDTGVGIALDRLAGIFEAFTQEDQTTTRRFGGTGLGLSIAKRLCEAMGGQIGVASEPGKGSRFVLRLPVAQASTDGGIEGHQTAGPPPLEQALGISMHLSGTLEAGWIARRAQAAGALVGTDAEGAGLVLAEPGHIPPGASPARTVLVCEPGEAETALRSGRAVGVLQRPVRHGELDQLLVDASRGIPLSGSSATTPVLPVRPTWQGARVLLVDDSEVNLEVGCEALARFGIQPVTAKDGRAALDAIAEDRFDLVLMDGSMPVLDGYAATNQLRQREAEGASVRLPVVALTAHVVGTSADAWRDAGMDGVLHKPFTLDALQDVLERHLGPPAEAARPAAAASCDPQSPAEDGSDGSAWAAPDATLFDPETVERLRENHRTGRGDFVERIAALYRSHAPQALEDLDLAIAADDADGVARAAHALKSMSLNIGASAVAERSRAIEAAVREDERAIGTLEQAALAACVARTLAELDATLLGPSASAQQGNLAKTVQSALSTVLSGPGNNIQLNDPDEAALARDLAEAIATHAVDVHYQPVFDRTATGVTGAEALVRWNRPGHGPVSPAVFVPLAERLGLVARLDLVVRRKAFADAAQWPAHVALSVNVSPLELIQTGFLGRLTDEASAAGLPCSRIVLEVTETAMVSDHDAAGLVFSAVRQAGMGLALDDFGTGWSSLTSLRRHPFTRIKIDREFVVALSAEGQAGIDALAIVQAVSGICRAMGRDVVAEGVETPQQLSTLKAAGLRGFQGYLLGKPMANAAFVELLGRQSHSAA